MGTPGTTVSVSLSLLLNRGSRGPGAGSCSRGTGQGTVRSAGNSGREPGRLRCTAVPPMIQSRSRSSGKLRRCPADRPRDPTVTRRSDESFDRVLHPVKLRATGGRSGRRTASVVRGLRGRSDPRLGRGLRGARRRTRRVLQEAAQALPLLPGDPRAARRLSKTVWAVFACKTGQTVYCGQAIMATSTATTTNTSAPTTEPGATRCGRGGRRRSGTEDWLLAFVCI